MESVEFIALKKQTDVSLKISQHLKAKDGLVIHIYVLYLTNANEI